MMLDDQKRIELLEEALDPTAERLADLDAEAPIRCVEDLVRRLGLLLEAVDSGKMDAPPLQRAHLEGAVVALRALTRGVQAPDGAEVSGPEVL
ncbi:hypothetical protein [Rhodococcus indonesiensis]|uniref:hypothetical protein n=1 Tax=Rhodococcus indonesiensis TaxID=3055869 RepID=UPI0039F6C1A2